MTGTGKGSGILEKARAVSDLARADLVLGAGIFVVAGEVLAIGHLPSIATALLGFLTGLFVSGSANISNDYFDRDVDRVNRPDRPLPSGRISVAELRALFVVFAAAGLVSAALLGPAVLAMAAERSGGSPSSTTPGSRTRTSPGTWPSPSASR